MSAPYGYPPAVTKTNSALGRVMITLINDALDVVATIEALGARESAAVIDMAERFVRGDEELMPRIG
jgi:hypothetical protein